MQAYWANVTESFAGVDVVVYGSSDGARDALISAGAVAAGVPVVVCDLPNPSASWYEGRTVIVAPSDATALFAQQQLSESLPTAVAGGVTEFHGPGAVAKVPAPPFAVLPPGVDTQRFRLADPAGTRARRGRPRYVHCSRLVRGCAQCLTAARFLATARLLVNASALWARQCAQCPD